MYLKRLELLGFKSFPDKTVIKLTPGVTSIVGPNGCGKTNILDAIRWVLGEQKVSQLRGTKMEEVIFNGTRDIKPLGMAEVTLVVQNNKGQLPTEYGEVQITRRLFRSGESEYLINKVPCRLKDITELFMDTGLGAHVYSVIQQHMIEAILSDRADDRRFLFEEAAGISKYKNRKKAAIRKLEATDNDLLRLKDIVAEINSQVNSLKRQMSKARRYKEMTEELKGWEIYLGKSSIEKMQAERRELLLDRDSSSDNKVKNETEIDTFTAEQEKHRKYLTDIDLELTELAGKIYEKTEQAHSKETEISVLRERRENNAQIEDKNNADIENLKARKQLLFDQIDSVNTEISSAKNSLEKLSEELTISEETLNSTDEKVLTARKKYDELKSKLMALESQLSIGKSDDSNLKEQESDISKAVELINQQLGELDRKKTSALEKKNNLENDLFGLKNKLKEYQESKLDLESKISGIVENLDDISGRVFDLSASLEAAEARRNLLEEMILQYEGFGSGVIAVMEDKEKWPGLFGTVADNIIPEKGFEDAVESALGDMAGYMICYNRESAESIIAHLMTERKGRAGFLILDKAITNDLSNRPAINSDKFIGWADQKVSMPDEVAGVGSLILSHIAIGKPGSADEILGELPPQFHLVTTDGKYYESGHLLSGGSREGISLLGRQEKIKQQVEKIEELTAALSQFKDKRNESTRMLGSRQAELNNILTLLESGRDEVDSSEREITSVKYEIQTVENEIERLSKDSVNYNAKLETLKTRQYTLNLSHGQLNKEKEVVTNDLTEQEQSNMTVEEEADRAESTHSGLQIRQVELKSKLQQLESQLRHTNELILEIDNNISTKTNEIERAKSEIVGDGTIIDQLEQDLKIVFEERTNLSEEQTAIREKHSDIQKVLDELDTNMKEVRQAREESGAKLHSAEIRITEIDSYIDNLARNLNEEYNVDIEEVEAAIPNNKIPTEERSARMTDLKERLRDFGGVNLLALEEFETAQERQIFLTTQMDDLLNAKSTLQSTIGKINQTAKELFSDTMEQVRANFKQVFEELFTGGEADLRLTNPDDPLESPIEIIARPRGKKLLSIAQMSGGERALTAISLLFSIYLVKPSPFCILDEIDAPLDDANVHRFLKIIRTFSEQTQFIVITHNKITMEAADNLYGITMEQAGVSRVVSVRFNEDDDESLIDVSMSEPEDTEVDLPDAIKERITPKVNIITEPQQDE